MEFKLAIGDPASKKTFKAELKSPDADKLVGKKISEKFKGELLGLAGYELEITGGSDNAGFPMRKDVDGPLRKKLLLTGGIGFHSKRKGLRRKKSVRGNTISPDTAQVNCKVVKAGSKKLTTVFGVSEKKEEKAEAPAEKPVEAPKAEEKPKKEEVKEKPKAKEKVEAPKEEVKEEKPAEEAKPEEKK
jgi:small subunit ribosomal protein S6e